MTNPAHNPADVLLHPEEAGPQTRRSRWRLATDILGVLLLAAAVWYAIRGADWQAVARADPLDFAWLLGLVLLAVVSSALMFWVIFKPFEATRPISLREWLALMFTTSLLNYFMRAGLVGRVAYMKKRHGVSYAGNAFVMLLVGGGTTGLYVLLAIVTLWRGALDALWWLSMAAGLALGSLCTWPLAHFAVKKWGVRPVRGMFGWLLLMYVNRLVDTLCFAGRFYFAAKIFGHPIDLPFSVVLGSACNFAQLATPVNLGVKEWVGAKILEWRSVGLSLNDAAAILIVDRAAEVILYVIGGVAALYYLRRKLRSA